MYLKQSNLFKISILFTISAPTNNDYTVKLLRTGFGQTMVVLLFQNIVAKFENQPMKRSKHVASQPCFLENGSRLFYIVIFILVFESFNVLPCIVREIIVPCCSTFSLYIVPKFHKIPMHLDRNNIQNFNFS